MSYDPNNPLGNYGNDIQVGGGNTSGGADQVQRQRLSQVAGGQQGQHQQGQQQHQQGHGGGAKSKNPWYLAVKAALGAIGGGLSGVANANNGSNNPFGSGFGNSSSFGGGQ